MIKALILKIIANAIAIYIADQLLDSMQIVGGPKALVALAVIVTIANIIVRPILKLISLPLMILTGGLFVLVINAIVLYLSAIALPMIEEGMKLEITSLKMYAIASLIIALISWFEWLFIHPRKKKNEEG